MVQKEIKKKRIRTTQRVCMRMVRRHILFKATQNILQQRMQNVRQRQIFSAKARARTQKAGPFHRRDRSSCSSCGYDLRRICAKAQCVRRGDTMPTYAVCPFFLYEKGKTICCELKPKHFRDRNMKKNWLADYCCTFDYQYCAHARKLFIKYNMAEKGEM